MAHVELNYFANTQKFLLQKQTPCSDEIVLLSLRKPVNFKFRTAEGVEQKGKYYVRSATFFQFFQRVGLCNKIALTIKLIEILPVQTEFLHLGVCCFL